MQDHSTQTLVDQTLKQLDQLEQQLESTYSRYPQYYEHNVTQYYINLLYQGCAWADIPAHSIKTVDWPRYYTNKYRSTKNITTHTQMRNIHNTHYCEDVYWAPANILYSTAPTQHGALEQYKPRINQWFEQHNMSKTKPWMMITLAGCWQEQGRDNKHKFTELFHVFTGHDLEKVIF
jgi:hypothetical protein